MNILAVKDAVYTENGFIVCQVHVDGFDDFIPFTASPNDTEAHGRQLYTDLKAGKYGSVTPFTVTPEMLTAAKQAKHAEINAWRNTQENLSYIFQFNNHEWDYGKDTQERLSLSVQMAKQNKLPGGFIWTDADNNDVPVSAGELLNLSDAIDQMMFKKGLEIHLRQRQMKEEVDALTDYQAIKDYVVDWPEGS
ncbi:TPA: DUF4376 domain-containing protein [Salmonella enterica]|nr:DUF4376 domain-containing protein [Salmonella enterica]